jgi:glycosyltransferase involved in cell wall biosynthesis
LGSLPPIKGVSAYTVHLLDALSQTGDVKLDVVSFRSIYPRFAYPGGDPDEPGATPPVLAGVRFRSGLTWYNPVSWLTAGLGSEGDVLHAQWWSYALAPVYLTVLGLARLRRKRVVLTVHNVEPHEDGWLKRRLNRLVFRFAHAYIVHSEQNRADLHRIVGGDDARITVLPHGVLETPRTGMTRADARARLGLPDDAKVVLCFGNIRPYKGVDVLLRAWPRVLAMIPDARLLIAGQLWGEWAPYAAILDELGITGSVDSRLGYVPSDQIEKYAVAADVVALPYTRFDAQSGAGARMLPFGRPLVVTDTGGLPQLVADPEAVVPPGDAEALAGALIRVLRDDELRERMGAGSLAIAGTLDWDRIAARTVSLYRSLLEPRETYAAPEETAVEPARVRQP